MNSFLIGAPRSGSGKSIVTMGLLRALVRRGLRVQSFKCGPDYLDPKLHAAATGRPSINLDTFLYGEDGVEEVYRRYAAGAEVTVAEGVMGLFDGYDRDRGSSAEVARLLRLPVVLVVTPGAMAYSLAPLLYGYRHFDPRVSIAGVILNKVSSPRHRHFLTEAVEAAGLPVLGVLPKCDALVIPERYLGLQTEERDVAEQYAEAAADLVEASVDLDRLLERTVCEGFTAPRVQEERRADLRIAVARDEACSFVYEESLRVLARFGEVTFFSPLRDERLPKCDFLYLPGGYPELYLEQLAHNRSMLRSLREYADSDRPLLAECGGMMLLCRQIIDESGRAYDLTGVLDQVATMEGKRLTLGYRSFTLDGVAVRGHEFHYSHIIDPLPSSLRQYDARGEAVPTALWRRRRLLASYTHLALTDELVARLIGMEIK